MSAGKGDKPRNCFSEQYRSNYDDIDWGEQSITENLKKEIEKDSETWKKWTEPHKKYMLICCLFASGDNVNDVPDGRITRYFHCYVASDDICSLRLFWESRFVQERYSTPHFHFIVDMEEKKVVEFLSVCV